MSLGKIPASLFNRLVQLADSEKFNPDLVFWIALASFGVVWIASNRINAVTTTLTVAHGNTVDVATAFTCVVTATAAITATGVGTVATAVATIRTVKKFSSEERERLQSAIIKLISFLFRPIKQPRNLNLLPGWAARYLPEEYRRHLIDFRNQWTEEGNPRWVIECKTIAYLLATVWAGIVTRLQSLVSPNRII